MINTIVIGLLLIVVIILIRNETRNENFDTFTKIKMTYVVNLDKDKERMEIVKNELKRENIPFKRFSAVNGKTLNLSSPKCNKYFSELGKNKLKRSQMGCSMSHITLWETIANHKNVNDVFMILEDDAVVPKDFHTKIHPYFNELPTDWDMLLLGANSMIGKKYSKNLLYTDKTIKKNGNYGTYAYLIRPNCAKKLLRTCEKMDKTIDHYLNKNFYLNHKVYFCNPHFVTHNYNFMSNIFNRTRENDSAKNNIIKVIN